MTPVKRYENTKTCARCGRLRPYLDYEWLGERYALECLECAATAPEPEPVFRSGQRAFDASNIECEDCPFVDPCNQRLREHLWVLCEAPEDDVMRTAVALGPHGWDEVQRLADAGEGAILPLVSP